MIQKYEFPKSAIMLGFCKSGHIFHIRKCLVKCACKYSNSNVATELLCDMLNSSDVDRPFCSEHDHFQYM